LNGANPHDARNVSSTVTVALREKLRNRANCCRLMKARFRAGGSPTPRKALPRRLLAEQCIDESRRVERLHILRRFAKAE